MNVRVGDSRFWPLVWRAYTAAPSVALCRVPELEYASRAALADPVLDHCCGDGRFAALAWPGRRLAAGCDRDEKALALARGRGGYERLDACDAALRLPYPDRAFQSVFNNSAFEHLADLDTALSEVARVLKPGGVLAFNVLNHRYFEWWPRDAQAQAAYREWQPFHHALDLAEWARRLARAGLPLVAHRGYFGREAAQVLAELDYEFSGHYLGRRFSPLAWRCRLLAFVERARWRKRLAGLAWETAPDAGAGYFIQAERRL